ncbi:MAG TPA: M48 family metallopeptidase [Gammaproteobacteria bacterium]|nr:M48 family metallopeptidase [Gammaproteobacteria bacterium]
MNFFEQQHRARRKTWLLVLYFLIAVALIIAAVELGVYYALLFGDVYHHDLNAWLLEPGFLWVIAGTVAVIFSGTAYTAIQLSGGGQALAEMVGATRIRPATQETNERKLMNVVEEMSIASGTPVPAVYVMEDESAINAFVAGTRPAETVLVVTRGALEQLNRDELQGVIAHENSHILNGDMRLNIRLMSVLAGILLIGKLGGFLLRSLRGTSGRSSGRGRDSGNAALVILALGLILLAIGYIGVFFGRLIKAAVSRNRECLADASSVQFTRNPDGIAGALWKIKESTAGSLLGSMHAEDLSHFCFATSLNVSFSSLLATHPPLEDRINAINPRFMVMAKARQLTESARQRIADEKIGASSVVADGKRELPPIPFISPFASAQAIAATVGNPTAQHVDHAVQLHGSLPENLLRAVHDIAGARQVIYALLIAGTDPKQQPAARALVVKQEGEEFAATAADLMQTVIQAGAGARLPIINLALPALKQMPAEQRQAFLNAVETIIAVDARRTVFEFVLMTLLREHLIVDGGMSDVVKYRSIDPVMPDLQLLLTVLARVGTCRPEEAAGGYQRVMAIFTPEPSEPVPAARCTMQALGQALHNLSLLTPLLKRSVITACADCVLRDGRVAPAEAELLQVTAEVLDCPMPPLLPPPAGNKV